MNKITKFGVLLSATAAGAILLSACSKQTAATDTTATAMDTSTPAPADAMATATPAPGVMVGGALMTPDKSIPANAMNASNVTTLVAAVKAAGLVDTLSGPGPFTVFAPTNDAFSKVPAATLANLMKPAGKAQLTKILTYHVVAGRYTMADLKDGQQLTTVEGEKLTIGIKNGKMTVNGANVETADVVSSNGVTFVIDTVLMPKMMK